MTNTHYTRAVESFCSQKRSFRHQTDAFSQIESPALYNLSVPVQEGHRIKRHTQKRTMTSRSMCQMYFCNQKKKMCRQSQTTLYASGNDFVFLVSLFDIWYSLACTCSKYGYFPFFWIERFLAARIMTSWCLIDVNNAYQLYLHEKKNSAHPWSYQFSLQLILCSLNFHSFMYQWII